MDRLDDLDEPDGLREAVASGKAVFLLGASHWLPRVREAAAVCDRLADLIVLGTGHSKASPRHPVRAFEFRMNFEFELEHEDGVPWIGDGREPTDLRAEDLRGPSPILFVQSRRHARLRPLMVSLARARLDARPDETHVPYVRLGDRDGEDTRSRTHRSWFARDGKAIRHPPGDEPAGAWGRAVAAYRRLPGPECRQGVTVLERHGIRAFVHPCDGGAPGRRRLAVHAACADGWIRSVVLDHRDGVDGGGRLAAEAALAAVRCDLGRAQETHGCMPRCVVGVHVQDYDRDEDEDGADLEPIAGLIDVETFLAARANGAFGPGIMRALRAPGGDLRARRDFLLTWPAMGRLILDPGIAAEIDSGARTVPIVARALRVGEAVARRVSALPSPPDMRRFREPRADDLHHLGRILSGIGPDRLPRPGDRIEGEAFRVCLREVASLASMSDSVIDAIPVPDVVRLLAGVPGRTWTGRVAGMAAHVDHDACDMVQGLAGWLEAMGMDGFHADVALALLARHASLLHLLRASARWHATPVLVGWSMGVPDDATWPVPFTVADLGDGWSAHALGSVREMADEGSPSTGGLAHCVATFTPVAFCGQSLILSIRRDRGAGPARVSTAELVPGGEGDWRIGGRPYALSQHRAHGNAAPPAEAVEALARLAEGLATGRIPVDRAALEPRRPPELEDDGKARAEALAPFWRPILPRTLSRLGVAELMDVAQAEADRLERKWSVPKG